MIRSEISCCYHPTTVVFVDDNKAFLENILLDLDENISACSFSDPTKAIEHLQSNYLVPFADKYLKSFKEDEDLEEFSGGNVEHSYIDIDLFNIHKEIYNPDRFGKAVVVIVDYTMPEMNGLELCKRLENLPFKFVLITGDATLSDAIKAFNEGLIHHFIPKNHPNFNRELENVICELQEEQFEELSGVIAKNLAITHPRGLGDPLLIDFIKDFFIKNNIVEYYLINESGCFLMADASGNLSWFVVKSEEEVLEDENAAVDNYGKDEVIRELRSREKLLFLFSEFEHINVSVNDWGEHLYPTSKIEGKNSSYYYSHIEELSNDIISSGKIVSYNKFLRSQ